MSEPRGGDFEARRQLLQMEMLYEIGLALSDSLDSSHVAQEILDRAAVMVDARGAVLLVRDGAGENLRAMAYLGSDMKRHLPQVLGLNGVARAWEERQLRQEESAMPAGRFLCFVPLQSRGEVRGLLVVADKEGRGGVVGPFSDSDENLLRSFALQAGAALQNARLHRDLQEAYEQLQAAQRQLAQMEQLRALGDLAAELTHELGHVLTTIIGRADVYLSFPRNPEAAMQGILAAAQRGTELIDQIQRFTRLETSRKRQTVDLASLVQETVDETRLVEAREQEGRQGRIEWEVTLADLPRVWGNPTDLKQVATNLLLNALEAIPAEGHVAVRGRSDGGRAVIEVRDTGVGIAPEDQKRVFDPFFTTKDGQGRGLGLSIVYRIVHEHGGEIEVHSTVGQGSCFTVFLPLADGPQTQGGTDGQANPGA